MIDGEAIPENSTDRSQIQAGFVPKANRNLRILYRHCRERPMTPSLLGTSALKACSMTSLACSPSARPVQRLSSSPLYLGLGPPFASDLQM